jgi:hypothetical protein
MMTFMPYPDFYKSASVLDYKRLGNQRNEARIIYNILTGLTDGGGWKNHPAVLMWAGHEEALKLYMCVMIEEWIRRGYKNTMNRPMVHIAHCNNPWWIGNYDLHISHQSNLVRKDPEYYVPIFGNIPALPYVWPTKIKLRGQNL